MGKIKEFVKEHKGLVKGAAVVTGAVVCGVAWYYVTGSTKVSSKDVNIDKIINKLSDDNLIKRLVLTERVSKYQYYATFDGAETIADLGKIGEMALKCGDCPDGVTMNTVVTGVLIQCK